MVLSPRTFLISELNNFSVPLRYTENAFPAEKLIFARYFPGGLRSDITKAGSLKSGDYQLGVRNL